MVVYSEPASSSECMSVHSHRIAIDIGGTFTDVTHVAADGAITTWKLLSTPTNYANGVIQGIHALNQSLDLTPDKIEQVLHACTVATNAILEHKGAKTALITTSGFRDVLELRRTRLPRLYDLLYVKPKPLVARRLRLEVGERVNATGQVTTSLNLEDVDRAVRIIKASNVDAVAVCLLHSYANDVHERTIGQILSQELPGCFISLSADVLPQMREYERTSTTVINAYVGPPVSHYLRSLSQKLKATGINGRLMVMQSSGGILDANAVMDKPAQIIECGPAAGVIGAAAVGQTSNVLNLISFDMGGTTAKVSVIEQGNFSVCTDYEVGCEDSVSVASPLVNGGGYALKLPVVDIAEVGAGGGSIVRLNKVGMIKVGPQSVGASPGPACYGQGGQAPTVTDANVILGYLNPRSMAGETVPIHAGLAERAIRSQVAEPLGRELMETAYGIYEIANSNMIRSIKAVTTYRGRDPRDFVLMAFGGSGGIHAVALARELRIKQVMIPPVAGVFSALGLLLANMQVNISRSYLKPTVQMTVDGAGHLYAKLEKEAAAQMGLASSRVTYKRFADMRYTGQAYELMIPLPGLDIDEKVIGELSRRFEVEYERIYGHRFSGEYPLETVNLRVVGTIRPQPAPMLRRCHNNQSRPETTRKAYFGQQVGVVQTAVVGRSGLTTSPRNGPLVIEEYEATVVVPPHCWVRIDDLDNIIIDLKQN